jgi:CheY-like chemotaxis protein
VVVVEDNPGDIYLIRQALEKRGIGDLTVLQDGEAGYIFVTEVERGAASPPDLFIIDLSLPRRSGPELLARIKTSSAFAHSRIIIASSSYSSRDRSVASRLGADRYFVKPSSFDQFMTIGALAAELLDEGSS